MRPGASTLHLLGKEIVDDGGSSRAPPDIGYGWFFIRLLDKLDPDQIADLGDNYGIAFSQNRFIQPGWFKLFLDVRQVAYLRTKPGLVALISVKQHITPDFERLRSQTSFTVQATDDWQPPRPIEAKRISPELFLVSGAGPDRIYAIPEVASVTRTPS